MIARQRVDTKDLLKTRFQLTLQLACMAQNWFLFSKEKEPWCPFWRAPSKEAYSSIADGVAMVIRPIPETVETICWHRRKWGNCLGPICAIGASLQTKAQNILDIPATYALLAAFSLRAETNMRHQAGAKLFLPLVWN